MNDGDPVSIQDYDPAWPDAFSKLAARVKAALGSLAVAVEHIGSTAVPGLAAKPIIDLDVVLASSTDLPEAIRLLATIGYVNEGDLGIAGREALTRWRTKPSSLRADRRSQRTAPSFGVPRRTAREQCIAR